MKNNIYEDFFGFFYLFFFFYSLWNVVSQNFSVTCCFFFFLCVSLNRLHMSHKKTSWFEASDCFVDPSTCCKQGTAEYFQAGLLELNCSNPDSCQAWSRVVSQSRMCRPEKMELLLKNGRSLMQTWCKKCTLNARTYFISAWKHDLCFRHDLNNKSTGSQAAHSVQKGQFIPVAALALEQWIVCERVIDLLHG